MKHYDLDLDTVLDGDADLTPDELRYIFSSEFEWSDEEYLVQGIKKYLRTPYHKSVMDHFDFTIEDMLNGRVEGVRAQEEADLIFTDWNTKIGHRYFGG